MNWYIFLTVVGAASSVSAFVMVLDGSVNREMAAFRWSVILVLLAAACLGVGLPGLPS